MTDSTAPPLDRELEQTYRAALVSFLEGGEREPGLRNAREIGRQAMRKGLGILELGAIHRSVLSGFFAHSPSSNTVEIIARSVDFLLESLSPFEQARREKEEFLSTLSHDLRNPLAPILGWARILKNPPRTIPDDVFAEGIETVERNAVNIERIVDRCLDLVRDSSDAESPGTTDVPLRKRIRVLVVEDASDVLFLMKAELEWSGFIVFTAQNGDAGLEIAGRELPDLIVSDIKMAGMDGYEFMEKLRAIPSLVSTPAIALTGLGMERDVERARGVGYTSHMVKPVNLEQLINLITHLTLNSSGDVIP